MSNNVTGTGDKRKVSMKGIIPRAQVEEGAENLEMKRE